MRERLREQLMRDEGLRLRPYTDTTGHVSIGYGRNLTDIGISEIEAVMLLENDIDLAMDALDAALPWAKELDEPRYAVLCNMAFNLGLRGLLKFKNTLEAVRCGEYASAADRMMKSLWARQTKGRAKRLAEQMRSGAWV